MLKLIKYVMPKIIQIKSNLNEKKSKPNTRLIPFLLKATIFCLILYFVSLTFFLLHFFIIIFFYIFLKLLLLSLLLIMSTKWPIVISWMWHTNIVTESLVGWWQYCHNDWIYRDVSVKVIYWTSPVCNTRLMELESN